MSGQLEADGRSIIEVTYGLGDLYAINWLSWRVWAKLLCLLVFLFLLFELVVPLLSGEQLTDAATAIYTMFPFVLIVLVIMALSPIVSLWLRKRQGWNVPMLIRADDEGITVDHPMGSVHSYWSAIRKVRATRSRLLLFTTSSCAYILPKRCFADEGVFHQWVEISKRRWAEAQTAK